MKISMGADHGGFELKEFLKDYLTKKGFEIIDRGTNSEESVDYPDFAKLVAKDILDNKAEKGVVICGTGIGISISANRFKGIRAALVHSKEYAKLSREHNDANVLALGGRFTTKEDAKTFADIFFSTEFEGGRHLRRINKMDD